MKTNDRDFIARRWRHLSNKAMARKLTRGDAKDVSPYRTQVGTYELPPGFFEMGLDYCDAEREYHIWSIGQEKTSAKRVFAAVDGRFYQNADYDCLWLR